MRYESVSDEKLTIALRRAARVRYHGRPVRARRERHPTLMRGLCVVAGFAFVAVLTVERIVGLI
jgi:hypothetical protein